MVEFIKLGRGQVGCEEYGLCRVQLSELAGKARTRPLQYGTNTVNGRAHVGQIVCISGGRCVGGGMGVGVNPREAWRAAGDVQKTIVGVGVEDVNGHDI